MSKQLFYGKYSEYELQALRIPAQERGQCLNEYVPYFKCILNANSFAKWVNRVCIDEQMVLRRCKKIQKERTNHAHLMKMKLANPAKFEELNVAPALDSEYSPSFLNWTRH